MSANKKEKPRRLGASGFFSIQHGFLPFQSNATRAGCNGLMVRRVGFEPTFQSNATHVGCNSKLVQTKQ
jgi:hypothetical protein